MGFARFGLLCGIFASVWRPPGALGLFDLPLPDSVVQALFAAIRLLLFAIPVRACAGPLNTFRLFVGVSVGYFLHAYALSNWIRPESPLSLGLGVLVGLLLLTYGARRVSKKPSKISTGNRGLPWVLGLGGVSLGLGLVALTAGLSDFTLDTFLSRSLADLVAMALVALGALAFSGPLQRLAGDRMALAMGPLIFTAACLFGLHHLAALGDAPALDVFLSRLGSGMESEGKFWPDFLIITTSIGLGSLAAGAWLGNLPHGKAWCSVLCGTGVGLVLGTVLFRLNALSLIHSAQDLLWLGALISLLQAGLLPLAMPISAYRRRARKGRWEDARRQADHLAVARFELIAGTLIALGLAALIVATPPVRQTAVDPFSRTTREASFVRATPRGLLTVVPGPGSSRALSRVRLGRRTLVHDVRKATRDAETLRVSFDWIPSRLRVRTRLRVLLLGVLTPGRALALEEAGAGTIDRFTTLGALQSEVEAHLFQGLTMPEGRVLTYGEAFESRDNYDLILMPPVGAEFPRFAMASARRKGPCPTVVWFDAGEGGGDSQAPSEVLPWNQDMVSLALAWNLGTTGVPETPRLCFDLGPVPTPWPLWSSWGQPAPERANLRIAQWCRRLTHGDNDRAQVATAGALEAHFRGQRKSSPFEQPAASIELPEQFFTLLTKASEEQLLPLGEQLWDNAAKVLVAKRDMQAVAQWIDPIAASHGTRPVLELALAQADLEFLDPEAAAYHLERAESAGVTTDPALWAELWRQRGDQDAATQSLAKALARDPHNPAKLRLFALQRFAAGDSRVRKELEALLAKNPKDALVREQLKAGPGADHGLPLWPL